MRVVPGLSASVSASGMFILKFSHAGSRVKKVPGSRIRIKEFKYFLTRKMVSNLSEILSGMFVTDSDLDFYPSRIQESKRHRIPDPDLQHCLISALY